MIKAAELQGFPLPLNGELSMILSAMGDSENKGYQEAASSSQTDDYQPLKRRHRIRNVVADSTGATVTAWVREIYLFGGTNGSMMSILLKNSSLSDNTADIWWWGNFHMMGQLPAAQNALFYDFCLERHIPSDHLLRQINEFLDFDAIRQHLKPFYSHTGRPSIDPELMIRMLLVGYCYGIRSERRLCEEVELNLAYRWFCQLGLEDAVPNHSSFSKNRHG